MVIGGRRGLVRGAGRRLIGDSYRRLRHRLGAYPPPLGALNIACGCHLTLGREILQAPPPPPHTPPIQVVGVGGSRPGFLHFRHLATPYHRRVGGHGAMHGNAGDETARPRPQVGPRRRDCEPNRESSCFGPLAKSRHHQAHQRMCLGCRTA